MIVDTALFEATSKGSAARILCRCDACGSEKMMIKQKLVQRGDDYRHCRDCYYKRNGSVSRAYIASNCNCCGKIEQRRADALKVWGGKCQSCASREVASRPEVKIVLRENGKRTPAIAKRGPESNFWRGGITPEVMKIRGSVEMKEWRNSVFSRDDYTCTACGQRGGKLEADHIMPFSLYPELRFSVFNGRTMCKPCHGQYGAKVLHGVMIREPRFPASANERIG